MTTKQSKNGQKTSRQDVYEVVTNRIMSDLEKGIIPWKKPWVVSSRIGKFNPQYVAYSRATKKPYSLLNQMLLGLAGEWVTYDYAKKCGGHVKEGEKGSFVVVWKKIEKTVKDTETGEDKTEEYWFLKKYTVFHVATQCENISPLEFTQDELDSENETPDWMMGDNIAEELISAILKNPNAWKFSNVEQDTAHYNMMFDSVQIPPMKSFKDMSHYYSTLFHEFTHATGSKSRLDRDMSGKFGSQSYAREELCAEIGASFMTSLLGLDTVESEENTTAYIQSWLGRLKDDKQLVVKASGYASKAIDYMIDMAQSA